MEKKFRTFRMLLFYNRYYQRNTVVGGQKPVEIYSQKPILRQMSIKAKKIFITTEKHERSVMFVRQKAIRWFCEECKCEVDLLNLDSAVSSIRKRSCELLSLIGSGDLHSTESASGHLLICKRSLECRKSEPRKNANITET